MFMFLLDFSISLFVSLQHKYLIHSFRFSSLPVESFSVFETEISMQQLCNGFHPLQHKSVAFDLHQRPAKCREIYLVLNNILMH
ncbi:hypothetical protein DFR30_1813 [Thiogranum longum]|uniref:Uncharacterized protein n=1 Tax=Thiogranum longum TaxID=1537524 RepID=A0A4R1HE00_9GAMM|nr:hypothetical protein DFR30_1813 [Thiogranum longum]